MNHGWVTVAMDDAFGQDPGGWLEKWAVEHKLRWLLAHADDGVIWGEMKGRQLALAPEPAPLLRARTLQQARLFGDNGELWLWREEDGFAGRWIDGDGGADVLQEETYLLWGQGKGQPVAGGFTRLDEGARGLSHLLPLMLEANERGVLRVRHYIAYDDQGQAYLSHSRLVGLESMEVSDGGRA